MPPSILKQLANYGVESSELPAQPTFANLPIEPAPEPVGGDDLEQLSQDIVSDIAEINAISEDISGQNASIDKAESAAGSIESIVDQTIETYGESGITEEGAALMTLSVEAVLKVSGLGIPVGVVVPSFESCATRADYSTEAEEKKKGVIGRILSWVAEAFKTMMATVAKFWHRLFNSSKSIGKYGEGVLAKINRNKGETEEGTINLGASIGAYCSNASGQVKPPASIVQANVGLFKNFTSAWHGAFEDLVDIKAPSNMNDIAPITEFLNSACDNLNRSMKNDMSKLKAIKISETSTIKLIPGEDSKWPLNGAKVELERAVIKEKAAHTGKVLKHAEMLSGCTLALKALEIMKVIEKDIATWTKGADAVVKVCNTLLSRLKMAETMGGAKIDPELRLWVNGILGGCRVMSQGWTKSVPDFLMMLKANMRYCDLSASKIKGGAGGSDTKNDEPDVVRPERYRANAAGNNQGNTYDHAK
ncbi:hypothetical protein D3C85_101130 [compost metagenome]